MEEFFQYIGPDDGAVSPLTLLNRERLFVYSSPREKSIERCGELGVGSYFACCSVLYYEDQVWLKIRRGYFSNAKNNGYIRVYFEHASALKSREDWEVPSRQLASVVGTPPAQFRYLRQLPDFPTYMCAGSRLVLYPEPVFKLHAASVQTSESSFQQRQRFLPPVSVFQATECKFNQDFTQLAIHVTSTLAGLKGWINVSYHKTLIEVEDPTRYGVFRNGPIYLQNVAKRSGKWLGELPVRALPSLQAPRLYSVENYRIVRAVERKLLKDRIWLRIQPFKLQQDEAGNFQHEVDPVTETEGNQEEDERANQKMGTGPDAWVIERNVNTAQRVLVPWGKARIEDVPVHDQAERYYRNVYRRRPLPLRRSADLKADIIGYLEPGDVFVSTRRMLTDQGRMWIRVAIGGETFIDSSGSSGKDDGVKKAKERVVDNNALESKEEEEEEEEFEDLGPSVRYGYALQSNAKTNTCMVQEIPAPGKWKSTQYVQVVVPSPVHEAPDENASSALNNVIAARADASEEAKALMYVKHGAIVGAIGTRFNARAKRMWLQVLATELDACMCVKAQSSREHLPAVVYLPYESGVKPLGRLLTRIENPVRVENDKGHTPSRVVFSGRASQLFGSHLLRPSTIDLPATVHHAKGTAGMVPDLKTGTQSLPDEMTAWSLGRSNFVMTRVYTHIGSVVSYAVNCLREPFASCLLRRDVHQRYRRLEQEEEGMEDYILDEGD